MNAAAIVPFRRRTAGVALATTLLAACSSGGAYTFLEQRRTFGGPLANAAPLGELVLAAHATQGVMLAEVTGITSTDDRLVWLAPSGARAVLHPNDGGLGFQWSPDGTLCQWGAFLHRWDTFDPVGGTSVIGVAPGGHWHLAP